MPESTLDKQSFQHLDPISNNSYHRTPAEEMP